MSISKFYSVYFYLDFNSVILSQVDFLGRFCDDKILLKEFESREICEESLLKKEYSVALSLDNGNVRVDILSVFFLYLIDTRETNN